jgi:H+/gluconate symporter-like permease
MGSPWLGLIGSLLLWSAFYLERQRRKAQANNEGRHRLTNEPETPDNINLPNPIIAIAPLILVGAFNCCLPAGSRSGMAPRMN